MCERLDVAVEALPFATAVLDRLVIFFITMEAYFVAESVVGSEEI